MRRERSRLMLGPCADGGFHDRFGDRVVDPDWLTVRTILDCDQSQAASVVSDGIPRLGLVVPIPRIDRHAESKIGLEGGVDGPDRLHNACKHAEP